jgi:elongation of very long chain fatty acids protein 6
MNIHSSIVDPNGVMHRWVFDFELILFDQDKIYLLEQWMHRWWWLSIPYVCIYIVAIVIGQTWMKKRVNKFELRTCLVLWNCMLAVFSVWGAYRSVPELGHVLVKYGFIYSICNPSYQQGVTGLWQVDDIHHNDEKNP